MPATPREPFAYQAAKTALWSPILAIGLGLVSQPLLHQSLSTVLIIAGVNILLLLTSFVLSIVALAAIPKLGKSKLLFRGLAGLFLSTLFLGGSVFLLLSPNLLKASVEVHYIGKWESHTLPNVTEDLTIQPDSHFDLGITGPGGHATISGTWKYARNNGERYLVLQTKTGTGPLASNMGKTIALQIQDLQDHQLVLLENGRQNTYARVP